MAMGFGKLELIGNHDKGVSGRDGKKKPDLSCTETESGGLSPELEWRGRGEALSI